MQQIAGIVVLAILFAGATQWWSLLRPQSSLRVWLRSCTPPAVPWGLVDLFLALSIWLVVNIGLAVSSQWILELPAEIESLEALPPSRQIPLLWFHSFGTLAVCALILLALRLRLQVTSRELGWSRADLASDVVLGARAFVMLAPMVYAIQWSLTQVIESHHPLLELLKAHPDPRYFAAAAFMAVLVAPVAEEFLFRVLLQGWLERAFRATSWGDHLVHGERVRVPSHNLPLEAAAGGAPSETTASTTEIPQSSEPIVWRPILVSSFCFALAHWNHGPDPIPLFVLAMGLGYLYQRTGRLAPCIVLHLLLNLCSLGALWVAVQAT